MRIAKCSATWRPGAAAPLPPTSRRRARASASHHGSSAARSRRITASRVTAGGIGTRAARASTTAAQWPATRDMRCHSVIASRGRARSRTTAAGRPYAARRCRNRPRPARRSTASASSYRGVPGPFRDRCATTRRRHERFAAVVFERDPAGDHGEHAGAVFVDEQVVDAAEVGRGRRRRVDHELAGRRDDEGVRACRARARADGGRRASRPGGRACRCRLVTCRMVLTSRRARDDEFGAQRLTDRDRPPGRASSSRCAAGRGCWPQPPGSALSRVATSTRSSARSRPRRRAPARGSEACGAQSSAGSAERVCAACYAAFDLDRPHGSDGRHPWRRPQARASARAARRPDRAGPIRPEVVVTHGRAIRVSRGASSCRGAGSRSTDAGVRPVRSAISWPLIPSTSRMSSVSR